MIASGAGTLPADSPPSLDALLGLDEPAVSSTPAAPATDERQGLVDPPPGDLMQLALSRMTQAARRLDDHAAVDTTGEAALATRRLQREALDALDALIAQLGRQTPKRDKSNGSSSSDGQARQADTGSQANAPRMAGGAATPMSGDAGEGHSGQASPGAVTVSPADGAIEQTGAADRAWGNLPAQVRGQLSQGVSDPFSAVYQRLTEAYYQRLAHQAGDPDLDANGDVDGRIDAAGERESQP